MPYDVKQAENINTILLTVINRLNLSVYGIEHRLYLQVNQDGLKLNGTHQLLAYADDVNILGGSAHTVKKNAETLVAATKDIGLEVNAHKTKYMTVSRDQNAGRTHSMKMDNSPIERVEEFKYLGTNLTNQNSTQEEIKCRL